MLYPEQGLQLAAAYAKHAFPDVRNFRFGALGLRYDGVIVYSRNGASFAPAPDIHAEARLTRKLDYGATVYVARILKNGDLALAKPCAHCLVRLRAKKVLRVYFTCAQAGYSCLILN